MVVVMAAAEEDDEEKHEEDPQWSRAAVIVPLLFQLSFFRSMLLHERFGVWFARLLSMRTPSCYFHDEQSTSD